ncbi:MAG: cell division protein CrgA [Mycobacteriales bacterium]
MPKSRVRKKTPYTPPTDVMPTARMAEKRAATPSPTWYPIVMVGLLLLGLIYIVVNYLAPDSLPGMRDLGNWNFAVGFGLLIGGLLMAVRWK